jgi:GNAT superfamily N-acetyltransferase
MGCIMQPMILPLPDGRSVFVRPITPDDKPLLVEGLKRLSPDAAFRRFLTPKVSFTEAELRYLTEVDGRDHIALVALQDGMLVAVARCVRVAGDTAELAIVVGDPWQGLGLGRRLTTLLAEAARAQGITRFTGTMLADNRPALALMRAPGARVERESVSGGVREVVTRLVA